MDERRQYERYPVILGSDIDAEEAETMFGLTQDLSVAGARLLTITRYTEGNHLRLRIRLDKENTTTITAQDLWDTVAKVRTGELDVWAAAEKTGFDAEVLWAWANGEAV